MRRALSGLLVFVPALVGSCALPVDSAPPANAGERPAREVARAEDESDTSDVVEAVGDPEPVVPSITFTSLDALCREQMKMVLPRLREAEQRWAERGETVTLEPRCEVSTTALSKVAIELRAPFLEARAIEVETGSATQTHLAIRTAAGWFALGRASVVDQHDDPGCFSIERDGGIISIRTLGTRVPTLVIVESSARGAVMEDPEGEPEDASVVSPVMWDDVMHRARACRAEASGYVACDAPSSTRTERVPSTTNGGPSALASDTDGKGPLRRPRRAL